MLKKLSAHAFFSGNNKPTISGPVEIVQVSDKGTIMATRAARKTQSMTHDAPNSIQQNLVAVEHEIEKRRAGAVEATLEHAQTTPPTKPPPCHPLKANPVKPLPKIHATASQSSLKRQETLREIHIPTRTRYDPFPLGSLTANDSQFHWQRRSIEATT